MTAGTVETNTAALATLSGAVAENTRWITRVSSAVGDLSPVTQPMMNVAQQLGVPTSSLASMSLAGAFVGPMLGVIALVYAAWPEEDVDPWFQVESRVAALLNSRFDEKRQKELGDRQRRYVKQFSRCAQSWK